MISLFPYCFCLNIQSDPEAQCNPWRPLVLATHRYGAYARSLLKPGNQWSQWAPILPLSRPLCPTLYKLKQQAARADSTTSDIHFFQGSGSRNGSGHWFVFSVIFILPKLPKDKSPGLLEVLCLAQGFKRQSRPEGGCGETTRERGCRDT